MPEKPERIHWDRAPNAWISPVGTVRKEGGVWTGHVYRNQRAGTGFTETKTGFDTAMAAAAWVENNAES
jgi:ribosomal protein L13E